MPRNLSISSFKQILERIDRRSIRIVVFGFIVFLSLDLVFLPTGEEFRSTVPQTTAIIQQRVDEADGKLTVKMAWRPLRQISPALRRAVIVAEDTAFWDHDGFDWAEMKKVLSESLTKLKWPRGASTISQQLAKNLYLSTSRNPLRKIREALITRQLEHHLSKNRILELYLNVIEWGNGIFGAEAAAQYYFKTSAASLSTSQAAFLAAIIPNPRDTFNPKKHPSRVRSRQQIILARM